MEKNDLAWLWFSAIVLLVVGSALVLNSIQAGWFLFILGIAYIALTIRPVQKWITRSQQ